MKNQEKLYKIALGENIRKIRKRIKLTQDAFSEKIGIEPSSLSNIENGKSFPSALTIIQIQEEFNVGAEEIFDFELLKEANNVENNIERAIEGLSVNKKRILWKIIRLLEV